MVVSLMHVGHTTTQAEAAIWTSLPGLHPEGIYHSIVFQNCPQISIMQQEGPRGQDSISVSVFSDAAFRLPGLNRIQIQNGTRHHGPRLPHSLLCLSLASVSLVPPVAPGYRAIFPTQTCTPSL